MPQLEGDNMASMDDLNSTQKGGVQNLSQIARGLTNTMPLATASLSPVATGINTLGTTVIVLVAANAFRHGIVFHNPGTVSAYIYPTNITTAPTTALVGGSILIDPGGTVAFPSMGFSNVSCGWSGFIATGSSQPLTVLEFL